MQFSALAVVLAGLSLSSPVAAQFVNNNASAPQGSGNLSDSENVDFADVDLDGDWDAMFADGGDSGSDQNRLWLNRGPNLLGFFSDATSSNLPVFLDASRDIEFADIDSDGDVDVFAANHSGLEAQPGRWWRNSGVGSGMFVDETSSRWINIGGAGSSVATSSVLAGGGYTEWSGDGDFADFDNDGDLDLFHSSYGPLYSGSVPSRIFLNDGNGFFEEFNPSGFQLAGTNISNGDPALWAEGVQQHNTQDTSGLEADIASPAADLDLMDLDGDLDIDILLGAVQGVPRLFDNRTPAGGALAPFRDVTFARLAESAVGGSNYEQEFGDLDNDGDVDLYGLSWSGFEDTVQLNDGSGNFGPFSVVPLSNTDEEEVDFLDFDADGDLDVYVANFSGTDRLYANDGSGGLTLAATLSTAIARDADAADLDNDGDYDVIVAEGASASANTYFENVTQAPDATAPSLYRLEQAPDRLPGADPTVIRVQVYDNAPYYITWYATVTLEYSVDNGPFTAVPMTSSGGQVFRATIPGSLEGMVCYRTFAIDEHGNTSALTPELCYLSEVAPVVFCTPKPSSAACLNFISTSDPSGQPMSGMGDYSITCSDVQGFKNGLLFAGISGPASAPFSGGTLCVQPPLKRGPVMNSGGSSPLACDGSYDQVVNDGMQIPFGLDAGAGNTAWYQFWYRDPQNGMGNLGTALSDGVEVPFM